MNPQEAIDLSREAIKTCMLVGGPILAASLLIGLIVGVIQAMTQVQDQTVSFVPKILLLLLMIGVCLPWLTERMVDFSTESFSIPMTHWEDAPVVAEQSSHLQFQTQPPAFKQPPRSKLPPNTASIALQSLSSSQASVEREAVRESVRARVPASSASFVPLDLTKPLKLESKAAVDLLEPVEPVTIELDPSPVETTSPFILPHYRVSEAPSIDIEG